MNAVRTQPGFAYLPSTQGAVGKKAANTTSVLLVAVNPARLVLCVFNESSAVMSLLLGETAAVDMFTVNLAQNDYYETPLGYIGPVSAVWASATGQARITELVIDATYIAAQE